MLVDETMFVPSEAVEAIRGINNSKIKDTEAVFNTSISVNKSYSYPSLAYITITADNIC